MQKELKNVSSNGNWGLRKDEPRALVNELKPEIIVRDGEPFIVNGGDPAFTSLKKDDIVFNGEQSEALLKNGYVTGSHGKLAYEGGAHSLGSAFSSGTGKFNVKSSGSKANSTSSKKKTLLLQTLQGQNQAVLQNHHLIVHLILPRIKQKK